MNALLQQLSTLLVSRRKELHIKQEDLAELTHVAIRTLRDMEKGIGNPSLSTIQKVMDVLGIELTFQLKK